MNDPMTSAEEMCQTCGACCAYSNEWPRFSTEDEVELAAIPRDLVARDLSGMRCKEDRCTALQGEVGVATSCTIYDVRPHVCRTCMPGDDDCRMARAAHRLPAMPHIAEQP